jgi:dUTP pyrophosphatase
MADEVLLVKKVRPNGVIPQYQHPGDAGMDVHSACTLTIPPGTARLVPTGIAVQLPAGMEAQVRPRSGLAVKKAVTVLNSPGTIDEGYRGEICVLLVNHGTVPVEITAGMRIAQLVVAPVVRVSIVEAAELSGTSRGQTGLGSTGE